MALNYLECPHCLTTIVPNSDDECPSCRRNVYAELTPDQTKEIARERRNVELIQASGTPGAGTAIAAILVGFIIGIAYYVFYELLFEVLFGLQNENIDLLARWLCTGAGILTAFWAMGFMRQLPRKQSD